MAAADGLQGVADAVAAALSTGTARSRASLQQAKAQAARSLAMAVPSDADVAALLPPALRSRHAGLLRTKPTRSRSGVAVVAVMSSPAACPHGKCTFCPGGPDVGVPQSYTGFEPSTMRAIEHGYRSYGIVRARLAQLARNGHAVAKVEIVIQGGTFPAREAAYQDWFVAGIYAGLNAGPGDAGKAWDAPESWEARPAGERDARLRQAMRENETAACRCVGLTIETKPDWCLEPHVDGMLRLGATRVEVGLQTLDEATLAATHRGHTLDDSRRAMQVARDAGLKVCAHLMPGLPRPRHGKAAPSPPSAAATAGGQRVGTLDPIPDMDLEDFRRIFSEPDWRPDMLKVYPTLVVREGETLLKRQWERGEYHPYDSAAAADVIARGKAFVPEWCRIQRIDRDIPTTHVEAGVANSNLRQLVAARLAAPCRCIRCREVGARAAEGVAADPARLVPVRREYEASGGTEVFLSMEDPQADAVAAFLRLRRVGPDAHRPECRRVAGGVAFVRELKVYGTALPLGDEGDARTGAFQHAGLGSRLLAEGERVAFSEWGCGRLLVIAGVGVKEYYRMRGYNDAGPYVGKDNPARPD